MDADLKLLSATVGAALRRHKSTLACAESCTGGLVGEIVTATAGSSEWFDRGFVTYSNTAKEEMLGVPAGVIAAHGAVSEETAQAMATGALTRSHADVSLAITGIAGPGGGSSGKPVGTVCFGWCRTGGPVKTETAHFSGTRENIRKQAAVHALNGLLGLLKDTAKIVP